MSVHASPQRKPEPLARNAGQERASGTAQTSSGDMPRYLAPIQRKCDRCDDSKPDKHAKPKPLIGVSEEERDRAVQREGESAGNGKGAAPQGADGIHGLAYQGVAQASEPMPGLRDIQSSFGRHDISDVQAQVGGSAQQASENMGARAYTVGNRVGFKSEPDLHLSAHEAAHVVQQRRGVRLKDGVGRQGDHYEQQADAVADRVVAHQSAEDLLDQNVGGEPQRALQHKCSACGGSGCSKCGGAGASDDEAVQMDLEVNATRLFEPPFAEITDEGGSTPGEGESSEAEGEDEEGGEEAESSEGSDETAEGEAEGGGDAGAGGGDVASAAPAAGGAGGEGGAGGAPAAGGGCTPACYDAPSDQPAEEPDSTPPNPDATEVEEHSSAGDEEEAEEPDDCPAEEPGATAGAPVAGAPGAPAAAAAGGAAPAAASDAGGPAEGEPAAGPGEGADAAASSEASGGEGGGGADAGPAMSVGSPLDGVIAATEGQRASAVAQYQVSSAALAAAGASTGNLRAGTRFAERPGESTAAASQRQTAASRADRFFSGVADRLDGAISLASEAVPNQLGMAAESAKAQIATSIEMQKSAISQRIAQARRQALRDAATAREAVIEQEASFVAEARSQASAAIEALTTTHGETMGEVDTIETTTLDMVNEVYATGRTDLEAIGTTLGDECTATGNQFAATYRTFSTCTENGFWDGNLSQRRARAQAEAAEEVAKGYHDRMVEGARTRAREITRNGRKADRCAVIASARQARSTLDTQLTALTGAIETTRDAAISQAGSTRTRLLGSIGLSLHSTLRQLGQQEHDQRQSANDTGYMQQMLQEQIAHSSAVSIQQAVTSAVGTAQQALVAAQAQCAANLPPDPDELGLALAQVEQNINTALGSLYGGAEGGALAAESQLAGAAQQGLSALEAVTQGNSEQAGALSDGFTTSMSLIAGRDNFATQRTIFTQQMTQATEAGCAALAQVAAGMQQGAEAILTAASEALTQAHTDLEANLNQGKQGLECAITAKATDAASHEAPAWKQMLAVLLVILVIVIVIAVTVLTAGMALGPLAMIGAGILIGAAVGAVTSALLSVAGDLWSNRAVSADRALDAAIEGAITGAIGGGFGAAAGLATKGASVAVQLGAQLVVASGVNVGAQLYHSGGSFENFSFKSLGFTALVTVLTFGLARHVASVRAGGAPTPPRPGAAPAAEVTAPGAPAAPEVAAPSAPRVAPGAAPEVAPTAPTVPEVAPTGPRLRLIRGGGGTPEPVAGPGAAPETLPTAPAPANDNVVPIRGGGGPRSAAPRGGGSVPRSGGGGGGGGGRGSRNFISGDEAFDMSPTFQPRAGPELVPAARGPMPAPARPVPVPNVPEPVIPAPAVPTPTVPTPTVPTPAVPAPAPTTPIVPTTPVVPTIPGPITPTPVIWPDVAPAPAPAPTPGPAPGPDPDPGLSPHPQPQPQPQPDPDEEEEEEEVGPFPIDWPSGLPSNGLNGTPIIFIGRTLRRWPNPRLGNAGEQVRVRRDIIQADPVNYPGGSSVYEAHHVQPMALDGLDLFPNVVPQMRTAHQSEHSRLQDQPHLQGRIWRSPTGPRVLTRFLWGRFGVPGHPLGVPYYVRAYK